ncbi:MAG: transcription-repair-coupling factor [Gemmatimonadota bacterium]|nr:MAG: transcription-repair-coupling factor [Gemmatimonadota bacterium]
MDLIQELIQDVTADDSIQRALRDVRGGQDTVLHGLACSAKAMTLARLHLDLGRPLLVIVEQREEAESLLGDLEVCLGEGNVSFFPETEVVPYDDRSPHVGPLSERIPTLAALAAGKNGVVVATARAVAGRVPRPEVFAEMGLAISVGDEIGRDQLVEALVARGYHAERLVEEIGTFAVRGGLVDFFPFGLENPIRVEFFGDEIESIRHFEAASQRTVSELEGVVALPQRELLFTPDVLQLARERGDLPFDEEAHPFVEGVESWLPIVHPQPVTVLEYFRRDGVVVLDEPDRIRERLDQEMATATLAHEERRERGHRLPEPRELFVDAAALAESLRDRRLFRLSLFPAESTLSALALEAGGAPPPVHRVRVASQETFHGNFAVLRERLRGLLDDGSQVHLLCDNQGQLSRLEEMLEELAGRIRLAIAPIRNGFSLPSRALVVLTDHELFARTARRYRAFRHGGGAPIHDYATLRKGDYVVHVDHGIGRYHGIERLSTGEVESECLRLGYQGGDSIFVPIEQINLVQKYVGGEGGEPPSVAKLGTAQWEKTKARVKKAVEKMAGQLLEVHAARASSQGFAYSADGEWQREMESSFIYEETPDQRTSTDAVKRDMEDTKPMDRLVCGDVGYGKTEVAIRAAFKAVGDGKQVAVLVPTTILAQQHLDTFRERLRAYPVKVDMVSRFRSPKEQKETIANVASGDVDILIGTHRILSKDVVFHDLGLVIVDEEQRFGVKHKERLKEMRKLVDVLTLTATPIPRTLNMALMGLREMSVINTPPPNKLPIVTEVVEGTDDVIKKAIVREIQRGGQVFFVHNRVQSIEKVSARLRGLLPELRLDVAHGQMPEGQLEKVMKSFLERRSDVLVSTMIIESGLDLPNVNTILINRADAFGLAQLYQLRGRVGRSNHRAFAHLLIPVGVKLSDIARKRLRAIEEYSDLGAGFRLAMRDMEIRGAGNFLGPEQSGHLHAIGYDLYCQMLREAIAERQGEAAPEERIPVRLEVQMDAYLPDDYIDDPDQRILFYKRLADLGEVPVLKSLADELRDRYGRLPEPAENLLLLKEMRVLAETAGVEEVRARGREGLCGFATGREPGPEVVKRIVHEVPGRISFQADGREGLRVLIAAEPEQEALASVLALLRITAEGVPAASSPRAPLAGPVGL